MDFLKQSGMNSLDLSFILGLIVCEIYEGWWQYAPTFGGILSNINRYYRTNIFLFFLMHPSFYLVLFIFLYSGKESIALSLILVMKAADITTKLLMLKKMEHPENLSYDFKAMMNMPIAPWMPWIGVLIYPFLLAWGLN